MIEPENVDEDMRDDAVVNDDLTDAPATKTDISLKSLGRKKTPKTSTARHQEELSTKRISFEETAMEDKEHDGIDIDSLAARREDQLTLYHAMLGHDLPETYARLKLARDRHIVGQLM